MTAQMRRQTHPAIGETVDAGGHDRRGRRARPAGNAGGNAAGDVQSAPLLRRPAARIPRAGAGTRPRTRKTCNSPARFPPTVTTRHHAAGRRQRPDHSPRAGRRCVTAGRFTPGDADRYRFAGPQGPAVGRRRQRAGIDPVPGRRRSRLVPGHADALRRQGQGIGLRRRLPLPSRSGPLLQGPRGRPVRGRDQGRHLPRPRGFRLSHHPRRAAVRDQHLPAGRPGRRANHRRADGLEPARRQADDGRQGQGRRESIRFRCARAT